MGSLTNSLAVQELEEVAFEALLSGLAYDNALVVGGGVDAVSAPCLGKN